VRIGIDARELCGHSTGVGRYLDGLLQQWAAGDLARRHEFVLYVHQPIALPLDARRFPTRVVEGQGGTRWEQQQLLPAVAGDHLDVFFAPGYTAPLFARVPLVVAIHDVSFAAHPEWFSAREGLRRRIVTRRVAAAARAITTLSEFSKRELIDLLGVPSDKIHIIRPGITRPHSAPATVHTAPDTVHTAPDAVHSAPDAVHSAPATVHSAPRTPHLAPRVLYVGSIFNRRHVPDLIRAFAQVARSHADATLDLVGDDRSYPREDIVAAIARERMDGRVLWHQYVSDVELNGLYSSARAFAFLSEYEGLGLTPLEALMCGVPSVLLDTPIAHESCGGAAVYVRKGDIAGTAAALEQLLFSDAVRHSVLAAAPAVLERYDWRQAARQTLAVLEGAA
jgi:glycosyltransferase involved in cell wall biosynthesis